MVAYNGKNNDSMNKVAVLTGDLVKSRSIKDGDIGIVINSLKEIFDELNKKILSNKTSFQIFRGDSFQAIIPNPELALVTAIIIRSRLRAFESGYKIIGAKKIR